VKMNSLEASSTWKINGNRRIQLAFQLDTSIHHTQSDSSIESIDQNRVTLSQNIGQEWFYNRHSFYWKPLHDIAITNIHFLYIWYWKQTLFYY
jgi:hypothetical protein